MSDDADFQAAVALLTDDLGLGLPGTITRLPGGRNNRVFRVDTASRPLLLKHYFRDPEDPRDRLSADFGFTRYAWESGVRAIAEPLAVAPLFGLAVYEFIDGRRMDAAEVNSTHVDAAVEFVAALNRQRDTALAKALPFASEACFSISDHVETVAARVRRLQRTTGTDDATMNIVSRLASTWSNVRRWVDDDRDTADPTRAERCLSPSDFGFHNTLQRVDGRLVFHDFEYAGWDDPAKLACDFFAQVEVPLPRAWFDGFIENLSRAFDLPPAFRQRVQLLWPVYRIKWCTIVLNELLPEGRRRRRFSVRAESREDDARCLAAQCELAGRLLDEIEAEPHGLR